MDYKDLGIAIQKKILLTKEVKDNAQKAFEILKETAKKIVSDINNDFDVKCRFENRSDYEFELHFGSDTLVFLMHTNIFEFSRTHEVMKLPYVKEDIDRSYCGMINIYNFLSDSFEYNRDYDIGYLIGRIFINKENHYFIEGKREVGLLYTNFNTSVINEESVFSIIRSSMEYANNFDLLTPPFDEVKLITVGEIQSKFAIRKQVTGKRLGFEFKQDRE